MATQETACPLTKGKQILVALDGSVYSENAVDQAISLGGMCNSKIYLISVIELYPDHISEAPSLVDRLTQKTREYLERTKEKVNKTNLTCETIIHIGMKPHEYIIKEARQKDIDLIIMGTHGRTGLKQLLLGSVAQKVVGCAPCPIMIIPTLG